ncbi:HUWE1-associated protein modifying stress responses 1-like [Tubulanus polymorphus]|uniref:HUWE1-associated protein modifying stress responses 1-like n=1 Tax=Tubulanus polymorphus TaxID=672921 RepID=UPI003DA21250
MADDSHVLDQNNSCWMTNWELQCIEEFENNSSDPNNIAEEKLASEHSTQKMWFSFQNSAASVAQLYKDSRQGLSIWIPFQNAASAVTLLYKDSVESNRRAADLAYHYGQQKRTKDILSWVKKRRRHIRREELVAFLCGKTPPPRHKPSATCARPPGRSSPLRQPSQVAVETHVEEPDLQPFRDALALQGLNGAMSNVSVEYRPASRNNIDDLNCFIMNEFSRHNERKRSASPNDVIMDSPGRKRSRLY